MIKQPMKQVNSGIDHVTGPKLTSIKYFLWMYSFPYLHPFLFLFPSLFKNSVGVFVVLYL